MAAEPSPDAQPPADVRPPGFAVLGCLAVAIQIALLGVVAIVILSSPDDPQHSNALALAKIVFAGIWIVSLVLLAAAWKGRSRWIIAVAVVAFAVVWITGSVLQGLMPFRLVVVPGPY